MVGKQSNNVAVVISVLTLVVSLRGKWSHTHTHIKKGVRGLRLARYWTHSSNARVKTFVCLLFQSRKPVRLVSRLRNSCYRESVWDGTYNSARPRFLGWCSPCFWSTLLWRNGDLLVERCFFFILTKKGLFFYALRTLMRLSRLFCCVL